MKNTTKRKIKVLKQRLHNCLGHIPVHEMTDGDIELYNALSQDPDIQTKRNDNGK